MPIMESTMADMQELPKISQIREIDKRIDDVIR